jgi:hypothetical protein
MANPRLVVRSHQPHRTGVILAVSVLGLLLGSFVLYEWGRYRGGYDGLRADRERRALLDELDEVKRENGRLREEIALLSTSKDVDREAYHRVEDTLAGLQDQIQRQREELAFYRGIVSPTDGTRGLHIQELKVMPGATDSEYRLRLVLVMAAARHDKSVSGNVDLALEGARNGVPVSYPLAELLVGDAQDAKIGFSFRYFQNFERELQLPEGFEPNRVMVEVNPRGRSAKVIRQAFEWSVQST